MPNLTLFDAYLQRWSARPDGEPFETHSGQLLPVRLDGHPGGRPAMIKIARHIDEQIGGQVMRWWGGDGAARIYAHDDAASVLLMERATGLSHLLNMAQEGDDDSATTIICRTIGQLHAARSSPPPQNLLSLMGFFQSLAPMARREGGLLAECAAVADRLLASQREHVVLHGDAHHSNILDFGARGWLAIDPKRVTGERCYDYANVLCNPDLNKCVDPMRFTRQVEIVTSIAKLERHRLLQWVMAHAALSAAWFLEDEDRDEADNQLAVARLAQQTLG